MWSNITGILLWKNNYDFIIGHIPYLSNGCLNLRDMSRELHEGNSSKVILVAHALPLTDEGDVDEECLTEWLREADIVLSVGNNIFMKVESCLKSFDDEDKVDHKLYLPGFPLDFFKIQQKENCGIVRGEQNILLMTAERKNLEVTGLNFELAVVSCAKSSLNITAYEGSDLSKQISLSFRMIGFKDDDKCSWERYFKEINHHHKLEGRIPSFRFHASKCIDKLTPHIKRAKVLIFAFNV